MAGVTEYPTDRPKYFAHKIIRLMIRTCAAQKIGTDAAWLVTLIAHTEDAGHYKQSISFWNDQLISVTGFGTWGKLDRARKKAIKAGWLHYEPGGKGKVGLYWVMQPPETEGLPDGSVAEDDPVILSILAEERAASSPPVEKEPGYKRDTNVREPGDNRGTTGGQVRNKKNPVPIPVPNPASVPAPSCAAHNNMSSKVLDVYEHYRTYHPKALERLPASSKNYKAVAARLQEGFDVDQLIAAIDGNHRDPHCCGENERGTKYHGLGLIFRDADHVNQYIEVPERPTVMTEKERRGIRAGQQWLEDTGEHNAGI
jgi:hypothetical protein